MQLVCETALEENQFKFEVRAPVSFPTTCGGRLELAGYTHRGFYSFALTKDPGEEQDVITSRFRIADSEGRVWKAISRFTTAKLLPIFYGIGRQTKDLASSKRWSTSDHFQILIDDAYLYDDSRETVTFYRDVDKIRVYLKHFGAHFAVSFDKSEPNRIFLSMQASVREESERELIDLSLICSLKPSELIFVNTATLYSGLSAASTPLKYWTDSPIPLPIIFSLETETLERQDDVKYVA
jgi:hypothetical protein